MKYIIFVYENNRQEKYELKHNGNEIHRITDYIENNKWLPTKNGVIDFTRRDKVENFAYINTDKIYKYWFC